MNGESRLAKYASLFEEIRARDIMKTPVTTLPPDKKISHAKEMMRIKRFSGLPVVDDERRLLGIITVEDIINALEFGRIDEPIQELMTRKVVAVDVDERLRDIVRKFEEFRYGRFPVVNSENVLQGIISRTDILDGVLEKFDLIYIHDRKRISALESDYSFIPGDKPSDDKADFHYSISTNDIDSAGVGAAILKQFLADRKFPADIARRAGVAVYEAEANVIIHSHSAGDIFCYLHDDMVLIRVVDKGVGIENIELAMMGGYSTASDYVRERGFGAGMGIPNMKRFVDKLAIISEKNGGTQVEMIFYLPEQRT